MNKITTTQRLAYKVLETGEIHNISQKDWNRFEKLGHVFTCTGYTMQFNAAFNKTLPVPTFKKYAIGSEVIKLLRTRTQAVSNTYSVAAD